MANPAVSSCPQGILTALGWLLEFGHVRPEQMKPVAI